MAQKAEWRFGPEAEPSPNVHFLISAAGGETRRHISQLWGGGESARVQGENQCKGCMQSHLSV